mmetsp:Transcript_23863/g.62983  ORF Transcript_23863/g.62983 Transcript_23863/m.62983 type:complete len:272 (-) Transcript_23863:224-1039(-)
MKPLEVHLLPAHVVLQVAQLELALLVRVALRLERAEVALTQLLLELLLRHVRLRELLIERLELHLQVVEDVLKVVALHLVVKLLPLEARLGLLLLVERRVGHLRKVLHVGGHGRLALRELGELVEKVGAAAAQLVDELHQVGVDALGVGDALLGHLQILGEPRDLALLPPPDLALHVNRAHAGELRMLSAMVEDLIDLRLQPVHLLLEQLRLQLLLVNGVLIPEDLALGVARQPLARARLRHRAVRPLVVRGDAHRARRARLHPQPRARRR